MAIWPFGNKAYQVIRVQFIDASGAVKFNPCDLPLEKLPASFEAATTMHLGNDDWSVVEARPMTAGEFSLTGKLVLIMQKIQRGIFTDTDKILYSLPTISNELPGILKDSTKLGKNTFEFLEDDWRQVEWVSTSLIEKIDLEIGAIRNIHERERVSSGFKKVHVRKEIPAPLQSVNVTLEELKASVDERATLLDGGSFRGVAGIIADCFAIRLFSSIEIYGLAPQGTLQVVGFRNTRVNNAPAPDVPNLAAFARRHQLVLVDWCRAMMVEAEETAYREYFVDAQTSA